MNIKVTNAELKGWLEEKDTLVKEGRKLSEEIEELEAKRNTCGMQIQKLKDKIIPLAEELVAPHLPEFGMLTTINIDEEEIRLDFVDQVEEFTKMLRDKKTNPDEAKDTAQ